MDTKKLRQKILDLAIRGKLVPQDPNDEPASVLLGRIREEKKQMVKDGRLKAKDVKNDTIIFKGEDNLHYQKQLCCFRDSAKQKTGLPQGSDNATSKNPKDFRESTFEADHYYEIFQDGTVKDITDEIPFDVPEGWDWCRLASIADIVTGNLDANAQKEDGEYPFFTCGEEVLLTDSYAFDCDAVLLGGNNAVGDFKMHRCTGKFNAYQRVYVITGYDLMNIDYLYYHVQYYLKHLKKISIGTQTRYLKLGMLKELLIAFPPSNEQNRIFKRLTSLSNYIDKINECKKGLIDEALNIKSKILNLAIQGKLIPQDPDDEPASVLLERIRAEKEKLIKQGKLKRDKKESIIYKGDDNSYYLQTNSHSEKIEKHFMFDLPNGWTWCVLQNVARSELGKTLDQIKNTGRLHPYLRSVNIKWDDVDLSDLNQMRFEDEEIERYTVKKGDLLICEGGDVGRSAIWNSNGNILYQNALHRVRFRLGINPRFFMYYLMYYESKGILKEICKGVTIKHLTGNVLNSIPFALPPLNEQNRIVYMIDDSFKIINELL